MKKIMSKFKIWQMMVTVLTMAIVGDILYGKPFTMPQVMIMLGYVVGYVNGVVNVMRERNEK